MAENNTETGSYSQEGLEAAAKANAPKGGLLDRLLRLGIPKAEPKPVKLAPQETVSPVVEKFQNNEAPGKITSGPTGK